MHKSSFLRMEQIIKIYEPLFVVERKERVKVLDVGSCGVNGTYRSIFSNSVYQYTGLDMVTGPNVDIVPKNIYQWDEIEGESFNLVISGQAFEHIEYPWLTIKEIARILKPSGFCILAAPSSGMEHKAPKDCYRYYADGLVALAKWANLKVHHVSVSGVPETDQLDDWIDDWNDAFLVAQKMPFNEDYNYQPFTEEKRIPVYGYRDIHKLWQDAVRRAVRGFGSKKPIVLFGAGLIGNTVLDILGKDTVQFFIDNSLDKNGREYHGVKVLSLADYLEVKDQYNCLITASYKVSCEIRKQLETVGVEYRILYDDLADDHHT